MKNLFYTLMFTAVSLSLFSCDTSPNNTSDNTQAAVDVGNSDAVGRVALDLAPFSAIKLNNNADVILKKGDTQSVEVEGPQKLINLLNKNIKVDTWNIEFKSRVLNAKKLTIYITLPSFYALHINGSGNITGKSNFSDLDNLLLITTGSGNLSLSGETNELGCQLMGSGNMTLSFTAKEASCDITGSGNLKIQGQTDFFEASISGSGAIKGAEFETATAEVRTYGSGNCSIKVSEQLVTKITGSGDIIYYGNPKVRSNRTGSGKVKQG